MNEVFKINRFIKLFVKHSAEHYKTYLMSLAVLCGVMLLGGSFITYLFPASIDGELQWTLFGALLLFAGTIFTAGIFSDLGDKKKSVPTLMLPATALEKFLVGWIYSYVLFTLVYSILFYIILSGILHIKQLQGFNNHVNFLSTKKNQILFLIFSLLHSMSIFGAGVFQRLHFIKTAFAFFIGYGLLIFINTVLLVGFTSKRVLPTIPFGPLAFTEDNHNYSVYLTSDRTQWLGYMILGVTVLFWVAAYFRLKEKQL